MIYTKKYYLNFIMVKLKMYFYNKVELDNYSSSKESFLAISILGEITNRRIMTFYHLAFRLSLKSLTDFSSH